MRRSRQATTPLLLVLCACWALPSCGGGGGSFFSALQDAITIGPDGSIPIPDQPDTAAFDAGSQVADDVIVSDIAPDEGVPAAGQPLRIDAIVPAMGSTVGGEIVTISGQGFTPGSEVTFGSALGSYTYVEDGNTLLVMTPAHAPGTVDVALERPEGDRFELPGAFEFASPIDVLEVTPDGGPMQGGTPIEVRGSGLSGTVVLLVGGRPAIGVKVIDDERVQAITPPGEAGPADVLVTTQSGFGKKDAAFRYTTAPLIASFSPVAGIAAGGTEVELTGAGLSADAEVWFGEQPALVTAPGNGTMLRAVTPGGPPGPVDLVVSTGDGDTLLAGAFTYITPTAELTAWNVWPATGSQSGGEEVVITVTGLGATESTLVLMGGVPATIESVQPEAALVRVRTPAFAAPGLVDVVVSSDGGESVLTAAFLVEPELLVAKIAPAQGPVEGGTPIVVSGEGFEAGATLRVGALPANSVTVVDSETITAVTPPGGAGYADVTVELSSRKASLSKGFLYTGAGGVSLYALEPATGAIAGGTYVEIYGSGFEPGAMVFFGDEPAASIEVLSPVVIGVTTQASYVQTVDVRVETKGTTRTLPGAFTFFNPLSDKGGTWGGPVDGSVNVTVLDGYTGEPVPQAVVILGEGTDAWVRIADDNGQTTFSKKGLYGPVKVSASKGAPPVRYNAYSVIAYDAKNVTIYILPEIPPSPGGGGGSTGGPAQVQGRVLGMDKYILPPPGDCAAKLASNPGAAYCQQCTDSADCEALGAGPGWACAKLLQPGWTLEQRCSTPCESNGNCPEGYVCAAGGGESFCHPAPPTKAAFCQYSKDNHFGYQPPYSEQNAVSPQGTYSQTTRVGEVAIVCWGGYVDQLSVFTPTVMGVRRHVLTFSDVLTDGIDVPLDIPLDRVLRARLLDPPTWPDGLAQPYFKISLELDGEDGYIQMPELPLDPNGEVFLFPGYPTKLTGPLSGGVYHVYTALYANSPTGMPYGVTFLQGITEIAGETMLGRKDDGTWATLGQEIRKDINALWGTTTGDAWAVGSGGLIVRGVESSWWPQGTIVKSDLFDVWGSGPSDVWAVGAGGVALHFDGLSWTKRETGTLDDLHGVWGTGPDDVFVAGEEGLHHWDGVSFAALGVPHSDQLTGVHGDATGNVFAVAKDGKVLQRSGQTWVSSFVSEGTALRAVWAAPDGLVVAVGDEGTVRMRQGGAWKTVPVPTKRGLRAVHGRSSKDILVAGDGGTLLRWNGTSWTDESDVDTGLDLRAVWAPADGGAAIAGGRFNLLIGPYMQFPKITAPVDNGAINGGFIAWEPPSLGPHVHSVAISDAMGATAWQLLVQGSENHVILPDFGILQGLDVLPEGVLRLSVSHILFNDDTPFDIDSYISQDLSIYRRRTWAVNQVQFF